jgi:endonuclease/exonuclease/phosphatase family metal-dependent hydrolase
MLAAVFQSIAGVTAVTRATTAAAAAVLLLLLLLLQDFIFVCPSFKVHSFGVVGDKCDNGCCPSDHKPIVADVELL